MLIVTNNGTLNRTNYVMFAVDVCLVTKSLPFTCSLPLLHSLHCLPVRFRIFFKINSSSCKTLREKQTIYLQSMLAASLPSCSLRSNKDNSLSVPRVKTYTGARVFTLVPRLFGATSVCPLSHFSCYVQETSEDTSLPPPPHRRWHAQWPVDVTELFLRFCCWILIRLSCYWAWFHWGY